MLGLKTTFLFTKEIFRGQVSGNQPLSFPRLQPLSHAGGLVWSPGWWRSYGSRCGQGLQNINSSNQVCYNSVFSVLCVVPITLLCYLENEMIFVLTMARGRCYVSVPRVYMHIRCRNHLGHHFRIGSGCGTGSTSCMILPEPMQHLSQSCRKRRWFLDPECWGIPILT